MPSLPQTRPLPGIWALGIITVASTPSNPVPITTNVGSQQSSGKLPLLPTDAGTTRPYTSKVQQLIFSAPSGNTGDIYVTYGNFGGADTNVLLLIVPKGTVQSLPSGGPLVAGAMDVNQIYVSGTHAADTVAVAAVWGN